MRLVERSNTEGQILIDNVDISRLTLNRLRSCISVIPQTPILFTGTLRYNLDPFDNYTDENCLAVLDVLQLKHRVCKHPAGLHLPVEESGSNFSVGERQLICVARAILKQSKIVLIDEASANVDQETDAFIRAAIVNNFRDCTILTIAHRLSTIAESDRILVMNQGTVANFDLASRILHEQ